MPTWLKDRLEEGEDQPELRFAFFSTVNWMRALATLSESISRDSATRAFGGVQRRAVNRKGDTVAFENLFFAFHWQAALNQAADAEDGHVNQSRSSIVAWYYCVYHASLAMIAAASGAEPEDHTSAARIWKEQIAIRGYAMSPFDMSLESVLSSTIEEACSNLRGPVPPFNPASRPESEEDSLGLAIAYLSGTGKWMQWKIEQSVKQTSAFRNLQVANFRTKAARDLRDAAFQRRGICFLDQAFRYRGKANYRDSLYVGYGAANAARFPEFLADMAIVAKRFVLMASHFVRKRCERGTWESFADDVRENAQFSVDVDFLD